MSQLSDDKAKAAIRSWIDQQFDELDRSSYYHLLHVEPTAHEPEIRDAYYRLVARLHPDLYVQSLDADTRQKLVSIYSRLVEAYRVLSDGAKREQYDRAMGKGQLRTQPVDERAGRAAAAAQTIDNPNAKRFFKLGQDALRAGNTRGAVQNLRFALSQEPQSELIKSELAKAEELQKRQGG
jgi:DnaJ-class molecular chaperone